jgi:hypothetical protein
MDDLVVPIAVAGAIACLAMDAWQQILMRVTGIPATNWALVGRWFVMGLKNKTMYQPTIDQAESVSGELKLGWIVHYSVSMLYAIIYSLLMHVGAIEPTVADGFVFGAASVVVPWFYFMPCMGKGIMGKYTANPSKACLISLSSHLVYGTAMGTAFLLLQGGVR